VFPAPTLITATGARTAVNRVGSWSLEPWCHLEDVETKGSAVCGSRLDIAEHEDPQAADVH
jgi:hypothetical protein